MTKVNVSIIGVLARFVLTTAEHGFSTLGYDSVQSGGTVRNMWAVKIEREFEGIIGSRLLLTA